MGYVSTVIKTKTTQARLSIPSSITKESGIKKGDYVIWTFDPKEEKFILELRRV